jgi:hypothetical protein
LIIGLVQLGAVVDKKRQTLFVAILAGNICWGSTLLIGLVQLGAVVDKKRQAFCVALVAGNKYRECWGTTTTLQVDIYACEKDFFRSSNFSCTKCDA